MAAVLANQTGLYLFFFFTVEGMTILGVSHLIRMPWLGRELSVEKAFNDQANNILDSISSTSLHTVVQQIIPTQTDRALSGNPGDTEKSAVESLDKSGNESPAAVENVQ